ncbi:sex peptide receptor-like [Limulus polyphemus]|uniref:Sex peptide receptor-like n=1 Tax=Limulus polyphemus TaxID=6850 RepID=A0ABM1BJU9_LIMPO|nr:sex peptide receptor-like [Limulus polyphemus]
MAVTLDPNAFFQWMSCFQNFSEINNTVCEPYMPTTDYQAPYYGDQMAEFRARYTEFHGYLSLTVCTFGIITNILNIVVLTRKDMMSPTNTILTGLAVADMFVMLSYVPYSIHMYIRSHQLANERYSFSWAVFTLIHAHLTVVCHTVSIWLTVTLAMWRLLSISFPTNSKKWCCMFRAKCAILCTYVCCPLFCVPTYLTFTIREDGRGTNKYTVTFSDSAVRHNHLLERVNFWIFSVLMKLVPCIALTGLSLALVRVLYVTNVRKHRLKNRNTSCKPTTDRTTKMLLVVLLVFLLTEFPTGILALLCGILGKVFFVNVYHNLGEVMDIMALINSGVNFILYCTMSRKFRQTFARIFKPNFHHTWIAMPKEPATLATSVL